MRSSSRPAKLSPELARLPCPGVKAASCSAQAGVGGAAVIQGFPLDWRFYGRRTASHRQIGNAFPPPAARAAGTRIRMAIQAA
jgi:DNA (cytosine-5)-methyltransferase 1